MDTKSEKRLFLASALIIPAPLMITSVANVYSEVWNSHFLIWSFFGILTAFVGYFAGKAVKNSGCAAVKSRRILLVAMGVLAAVICVFAVFYLNMSTIAMTFLPLSVFFWYWLGCRAGLGVDLLSNTVIGLICIEAAFLFPMCSSFDESGAAAFMVLAIFGAEIVIGAVLLNMRHLRKIAIRGNSVSKVSKNTLRFNIKTALSFAFAVLFFFIFAKFAGYWLWEALKAIIKFLLSLTREPEKIDVQVINDTIRFKQLISSGNSPLFLILMIIITVAVILFLIKPVRNAILRLLEKMGKSIDHIGGKSPQKLNYSDFYESTEEKKQSCDSFRRAYKAFSREKKTDKKYRLGYKAFIIGLEELGEKNLPSDTPKIHRKKEEKAVASGLAENITKEYENFRYHDGKITDEDCARMDMMLKRCLRKKRTKRKENQ